MHGTWTIEKGREFETKLGLVGWARPIDQDATRAFFSHNHHGVWSWHQKISPFWNPKFRPIAISRLIVHANNKQNQFGFANFVIAQVPIWISTHRSQTILLETSGISTVILFSLSHKLWNCTSDFDWVIGTL